MKHTEFREMMGRSYDFNERLFNTDLRWAILEEMYTKNFFYLNETSIPILPKIIHQIWLGGTIPNKYKQYADTWREFNPEWEYKLWTDSDVTTMDLPNRELYNSMTNYGPKSDLLRYHILNQYGGVYADTDFECLKSFDSLSYLSFFTGIGYPSKLELYPGLIGCVPHHPIMEKLVEEVCKIKTMPNDPTGVLETISSYFFTRVFLSAVTEYYEGIVAFPPDYFYPFPNQRGHQTRNGKDYIKDCSYAIHYWEVSWLK